MQQLQKVLHEKLLPQAEKGAAGRIIVAQANVDESTFPSGVQLTPHKMSGKRVIVKGERLYGNTRLIRARWPEARMHEIEHSTLIYVSQGNINYPVGNYLLSCREGDFILIPPGLPCPADKETTYQFTPINPCHIWFLSQYRRGLQCWRSPYGQEDTAAENYLFLNGQVIGLFEMLVDELLSTKNSALCDSLLLSFVMSLNREVLAENYLHPGPIVKPSPFESAKNEFTQKLEDYIRQHLNEHLTLDSVARHFYMSRAQFVRRVRNESGQTFVEFLTSYRLHEAKILLRESEWTAQNIAHFVGFKSPAYFHKLFVKELGCTPGKYRSEKMSQ